MEDTRNISVSGVGADGNIVRCIEADGNTGMMNRMILRISQCLVCHRYVFAAASLLFVCSAAVLSLVFCQLPDLSDPSADFVTVGTEWSAKVRQFQALMAETDSLPDQYGDLDLGWIVQHSGDKTDRAPAGDTLLNVANSGLHKRTVRSEHKDSGTDRSDGVLELCYGEPGRSFGKLASPPPNLWQTYAKHGRLVVSLDREAILADVVDRIAQPPYSVNQTGGDRAEEITHRLTWFTRPKAIASLCAFQTRITQLSTYPDECILRSRSRVRTRSHRNQPSSAFVDGECCPIWSLPNMIAMLLGRTSCEQISQDELLLVGELLTSCLPAFRRGELRRSCWDLHGSDPRLLCPRVQPVDCLRSPVIPLILATTLPDRLDASSSNWRHTLVQLPLRQANNLGLFTELDDAYKGGRLTRGLPVPIYLHGMYFHAYNELVSELALRDTVWLGLGLAVLLLLLGIGTCSLFIPLMTLMSIVWSVLVAYGLYTKVFRIPNFPLINLMTIVLAIGLGADDLLVYYQVWKSSDPANEQSADGILHFPTTLSSHSDRSPYEDYANYMQQQTSCTRSSDIRLAPGLFAAAATIIGSESCSVSQTPHSFPKVCEANRLIRRVHFTISEALPSMSLTSFSTLLGLLVNLLSSIVAVQRFALFSVLVVICNYLFVLTSVPITLILVESVFSRIKSCRRHNKLTSTNRLCGWSPRLSNLLLRLKFIAPVIVLITSGVGVYELFVMKRLSVPDQEVGASSFLRPYHPFETFLNDQHNWFWAERNLHHFQHLLRIHFVWGFVPEDTRSFWTYNHLDPHGILKLSADTQLNLTSLEARTWFRSFCDNQLRQLPYLLRMDHLDYREDVLPSFKLSLLNPLIEVPLWCPLGHYAHSLDNFVFAHACSIANDRSPRGDCCPGGKPLDFLSSTSVQYSKCLAEYVSYDGHVLPRPHSSGFRFAKICPSNRPIRNESNLKSPVGFIITVVTNLSVATSPYSKLKEGLNHLSDWFEQELGKAPSCLQGGHLVAPQLSYFQVQLNVTEYVYWSSFGAILLASLLVFLTSRNLLLSLLAFVSLAACLLISCTLLALLDNWVLGIVEGLVISLAAGLAIDPCIHLALGITHHHTVNGRSQGSWLRPTWSVSSLCRILRMLTPAVSGSTWSTAIAGLLIVTCELLCYHQVGVFLATLMICSWFCCYIVFAGMLACFGESDSMISRPICCKQ
ncbi:unnamed protein product [Calicophoron daubneyi]|uniref:SSD domain-containing protein n=1 Tax=Calicophoron daubneyi TaxID=300641 RepID=A0AAV2TQ78_CALDB